ncbi:MAG: D-glycerate dehydrogenase [Nitrospirae bacterium]|nr:MAG: D-glycerate dehydrogenase [Nitrospirota bacterium]
MSLPALYVSRLLPPPVMAVLTERFRLVAQPGPLPPEKKSLRKGLEEAEAAICTLTEQIDREALHAAPRLRVIANYAVGYNNIDLDAAKERGIVVTNTPDVLTEATADLAWALLLATARRIPEGHGLVQQGAWTGWEPTQLLGADVYEKTLGIVGMGRIGNAVARRAAGFRMPVLYCSRKAPAPSNSAPSWRHLSLQEVLSESDFVSLHVPLTPDTRHLIGAAELRLMRPTAFLINTSRGPVIDEAALVDALREHRLAGAGLDVYEQEPALHPGLRSLTQVVTLPHLGSATLSARVRMGMVCIENIRAVLEGRPAPNRVN